MSKQSYFSDDEQFSAGFVPNVGRKGYNPEHAQYKKAVKSQGRQRQKMVDSKRNWSFNVY